jgi:hypothetical protein
MARPTGPGASSSHAAKSRSTSPLSSDAVPIVSGTGRRRADARTGNPALLAALSAQPESRPSIDEPADDRICTDPLDYSQLAVLVSSKRGRRRRPAVQDLPEDPGTDATQPASPDRTSLPAHTQHRWAGGWSWWVCHRWSPKPLTTPCENFVVVSMSYVPGTVASRRFLWDRWRFGTPKTKESRSS